MQPSFSEKKREFTRSQYKMTFSRINTPAFAKWTFFKIPKMSIFKKWPDFILEVFVEQIYKSPKVLKEPPPTGGFCSSLKTTKQWDHYRVYLDLSSTNTLLPYSQYPTHFPFQPNRPEMSPPGRPKVASAPAPKAPKMALLTGHQKRNNIYP